MTHITIVTYKTVSLFVTGHYMLHIKLFHHLWHTPRERERERERERQRQRQRERQTDRQALVIISSTRTHRVPPHTTDDRSLTAVSTSESSPKSYWRSHAVPGAGDAVELACRVICSWCCIMREAARLLVDPLTMSTSCPCSTSSRVLPVWRKQQADRLSVSALWLHYHRITAVWRKQQGLVSPLWSSVSHFNVSLIGKGKKHKTVSTDINNVLSVYQPNTLLG